MIALSLAEPGLPLLFAYSIGSVVACVWVVRFIWTHDDPSDSEAEADGDSINDRDRDRDKNREGEHKPDDLLTD